MSASTPRRRGVLRTVLRDIAEDRVLLGVLAAFAGLACIGFDWGLPNIESWSPDTIAPWTPLRVPKSYFAGWHKYPHLHSWISLVAYSPLLAWWTLRGSLDPACVRGLSLDCFADPYAQLTALIVISRAISLAMGLGILVCIHQLALRLHGDRRAARIAAALAASYAVLAQYAHLGNLDVPNVFWLMLALLAFVAIERAPTRSAHLAFGAFAGLAIGTKEGIFGAFVGPCLWIAGRALHGHLARGGGLASASGATLLDRRLWSLVAALFGVYALAAFPFNWEGFVLHVREWLPSEPRMAGFQAGFPGYRVFAERGLGFMALGMGPPTLVLTLASLPTATGRYRRSLLLLLPIVSYVALSLLPAGYAPMRLTMPVALLLSVFGGIGISRCIQRGGALRVGAGLVLGFCLAYGTLHSIRSGLVTTRDSRYAAEAWLSEHVAPGTRIGSFSHRSKYLPRLAWLGYEVVPLAIEEQGAAALEAEKPELLVLSSFYYPRLQAAHREFMTALFAGNAGYERVLDVRTPDPMPWLGFEPGTAKVNPRIVIFRREQAPDASERRRSR